MYVECDDCELLIEVEEPVGVVTDEMIAQSEKKYQTPLSWDTFREKVFMGAMLSVQNSNCTSFKLMGYKHLTMRLILYFDDCNQVCDFRKGEFGVEENWFFTENHLHTPKHLMHIKQFKREMKRDIPE